MLNRPIALTSVLLVSVSFLPGCGNAANFSEETDSLSSALAGGAGGEDSGDPPGGSGATGAMGPVGEGGEGGSADTLCPNEPMTDPSVYDGNLEDGNCLLAADPPLSGQWYAVGDSVIEGMQGGADGSGDCALHIATEAEEYGGATVYLSNVPACALDASEFVGLRMKLKGSSKGTQDGCGPLENTVHVKISTLSTSPVEVGGNCVPPDDPSEPGCFDDFGGHCTLAEDFTTCELWFSELVQSGWGIPATFDPSEILSLAWLVEKNYDASELGGDFWIDDVEFIEAGDPATPSGSGNDCGGEAGEGGSGSGGESSSGGSSAGTTSSSGGNASAGNPNGGTNTSGGTASSGGTADVGGGTFGTASPSSNDEGCSCRVAGRQGRDSGSEMALSLVALGLILRQVRRTRRQE